MGTPRSWGFRLVVTVVMMLCFSREMARALQETGIKSAWNVQLGLQVDAEALLAFKLALHDPAGVLRGWSLEQSPCSWTGVTCGQSSPRVTSLEIKDGGLRGHISPRLGDLTELRVLTIEGNRFAGVIPEELWKCQNLEVLDLRRNGLSGPVPAGLFSLLPNLRYFVASENNLSGRLVNLFGAWKGGASCGRLQVLDLSRNRLTGALPKELSSCAELVEARLGSNFLKGDIPSEYGELRNLESLALENNVLGGHLPRELTRCTKLKMLDVADNFLSGEIPSSFVELRELQNFRVTNNRLSGPIPKRKWSQASAFLGNDGLCGQPLQSCAEDSSLYKFYTKVVKLVQTWREPKVTAASQVVAIPTRRSMLGRTSKHRSTAAKWGLGIALGLVTGMVCAALLAIALRFALGCYTSAPDLKKPIIFNKKITPGMLAFLDKEDALASADLIGEGGNGKVYRVPLNDSLVVAIKSVKNPGLTEDSFDDVQPESHDARQIQAELETLGVIRHRNLVQLWAYVYKADSHLLIYEYMHRGSLQDAFYQMAAGNVTLSWPQRHLIICGVAEGIVYLHNMSLGSSIVHRDLKPANILLDDNYEAKVADFGLAAIIPNKDTHATTDAVAGTIGFIAPEYHQTMR